MNNQNTYLSELFRIVSGALKLDTHKVRNYASFLAEKLETDGDVASATRLRKMLAETENQLHPANLTTKSPPVDGETRFPLLENVDLNDAFETRLILSNEQRDLLHEFIAIAKSQTQFENQGINTPLALLLYGSPGTGKGRIAREVARALSLKLFVARLDGLISSYLGSTSKNIRAVFEYASRTPCVLFLDEFDAIAKLRDDSQELGELKRVVNSFLQNLDSIGTQSVVIAATNHQQLLDSAVWRRFNYRIDLKLPLFPERLLMWKEFLKPIEFDSRSVAILSDLSDGFSGADIREVTLRLKRQSAVTKNIPSLNDAFINLKRLSTGADQKNKYLFTIQDQENRLLAKSLASRDKKRYSVSGLARLLQVSRPTVYKWMEEKKGA